MNMPIETTTSGVLCLKTAKTLDSLNFSFLVSGTLTTSLQLAKVIMKIGISSALQITASSK